MVEFVVIFAFLDSLDTLTVFRATALQLEVLPQSVIILESANVFRTLLENDAISA